MCSFNHSAPNPFAGVAGYIVADQAQVGSSDDGRNRLDLHKFVVVARNGRARITFILVMFCEPIPPCVGVRYIFWWGARVVSPVGDFGWCRSGVE